MKPRPFPTARIPGQYNCEDMDAEVGKGESTKIQGGSVDKVSFQRNALRIVFWFLLLSLLLLFGRASPKAIFPTLADAVKLHIQPPTVPSHVSLEICPQVVQIFPRRHEQLATDLDAAFRGDDFKLWAIENLAGAVRVPCVSPC